MPARPRRRPSPFSSIEPTRNRSVSSSPLVAELDDDPGGHDAGFVRRAVDDDGVLKHPLQLADAGLHLALGVLGGVIVAVLRQVAERPRGLDLPGDLHPAAGRQVLELCDKADVRLGGEMGLGHADEAIGLLEGSRRRGIGLGLTCA